MESTGHLAGRRCFGRVLGIIWTSAEDRGVDLRSCGLEGTWGFEIPEGVGDEVIGPA
jgi:hypothetical protein